MIKKILLSLFAFIIAFVAFVGFTSKVKADVLTDANIVVEGASIKTSGDTGLKFVGNIDSYVVPDGRTIAKYGFVIAITEAPASEDFVIGGTVDGNPTSAIELTELDTEGKFNLVILNIPQAQAGFNLSARAYVRLDDDTVVYGTESTVRNMLEVAIAAVESGELDPSSLAVVETIITNSQATVKKYFVDNFGSLYIDSSVYESNPANLYISFAKAWNAYFATEIAAGTVNSIDPEATRDQMGPQLKAALQGTLVFDKDANIVKFFVNNHDAWGWMLDFFSYGGGNPEADLSLVRQCELIEECYTYRNDPSHELTPISINDWYKANNLITYMADYFTQTNYNAFADNDEYGIVYFTEGTEENDYAPVGNDYRRFFATVINPGFNDAVNAINANYIGVGETLVLPAVASHTGYTGYYVNAADPLDTREAGSDYVVTDTDVLYLTAQRLTTFNITYELNAAAATNNVGNPATYNIKTAEITLQDPTRAGYSFAGWYLDAELTQAVTKITPGSADGKDHADVKVYAKWTADANTVEYHLNGSTAAPVTNHADNPLTIDTDVVVTLKDPSRDGYTFAGWFKDAGFTQALTDNKLTGAAVMDVYAKWTVIEYAITYTLDGATNAVANPAKYTIEDTINFADPTKTGYTFNGWFTEAEFTNAITKIDAGSTGDVALFAKLTANANTVGYHMNDSVAAPATNNENNPITLDTDVEAVLQDPTRPGYTFAGWFKDALFAEALTDNKIVGAPVVDVYAKWTVIEYDITYNLNEGTNAVANPAKYTIEDTINFADPTKTGYTFNGWFTEAEFTNAKTKIDAGSTGAVEVFAKWSPTEYTITYTLNGGTNAEENPSKYTILTETITLADPSKAGYDFAGWYTEAGFVNQKTTIDLGSHGNLDLYAKFTPQDVEITFNHNDYTTLLEAWNNFRADVIAACVAHDFANEYRANFLNHSRYNEYYYDYLPLSRVLAANWADCDAIRTNYAWLFTLISTVADSRVATEIAGFNTKGNKSADAIYVFCQEFKNCYYIAMNDADLTIYGYTSASLTQYELYDWNEDEAQVMDQLKEATKSADSVQSLTVDTAIAYNPVRAGYVFGGWFTNEECTGDAVTTVPTAAATLYAKWTVAP